jgi:nucleoside-diphosphate-sugar epimerase
MTSNTSTKTYTIDKSKPVLVTGATGYVAGVVIKELLDEGVTVHATVRDASKKDSFQYLQDVADQSPGTIKFFSADLLLKGSFAEAMKGCAVVFHMASPFNMGGKGIDPQTALVDPAVKGTENVLFEVNNTPSVKRVVVTSSAASIYHSASETYTTVNGELTEEHWNRGSSLTDGPYSLSKTLAEQRAWSIAGSQTQWDLSTLNPSLVLGPGLKYHQSSESYKTLITITGGELAYGCPNFGFGVVDVREVAHAHLAAGFNEKATGRHILSGTNTSMFSIAQAMLPKYEEYPLPTGKVPFFLLYLIAPYLGVGLTRSNIWNNVNVEIKFNTSKSKKELGVAYRPLEETLGDMMEQVIAAGAVEKRKKK